MIIPPAVDPKRLRIMKALQAHLAGINRIDGYNFDLAGKVLRNRIIIGVQDLGDQLPLVSIVEAPRADLAIYTGEWEQIRKDNWTLLLQGVVKDDFTPNTEDDAYYLCQDVERRLTRLIQTKPGTGRPLYPDEHLLGGIITGVEIAPPVIRPPEAQVSADAFFYLPVRLGVAVQIGE
jgi:hypothetical protein